MRKLLLNFSRFRRLALVAVVWSFAAGSAASASPGRLEAAEAAFEDSCRAVVTARKESLERAIGQIKDWIESDVATACSWGSLRHCDRLKSRLAYVLASVETQAFLRQDLFRRTARGTREELRIAAAAAGASDRERVRRRLRASTEASDKIRVQITAAREAASERFQSNALDLRPEPIGRLEWALADFRIQNEGADRYLNDGGCYSSRQ